MKIGDVSRNKYYNHKFYILLINQNLYMKKFFTLMLFVAMMLPWIAQGQTTPASLPYSCGFEDATENANWTFVLGDYTNHFVIASAVNNGGTNSLYITNTAQNTNTYTQGSISYSLAYREITFQNTGTYNFSYDWRAYGETGYDCGHVFLVPGSATIPADPALPGFSYSNNNTPSGWISLNGNNSYLSSYNSTWQSVLVEEYAITAGTYKLVVFWKNDASGGSNPPLSIDNILIEEETCPKPTGLRLVSISDVSATFKWNPNVSMSFAYKYDTVNAANPAYSSTVNDTTVTITGLTPNTRYKFYLSGVCGSEYTSWIPIEFETECSSLSSSSLPLLENFETWASNATSHACFLKGNNSTYSYPSISTSQYYEGNKSMYLSSTSSYSCWLILPRVDAAINTLQISFYAKKTSSYEFPIIIGVMPDVANPTVFDTVAVVRCNGINTWEEIVMPLSNYAGINGRLALISPDGVSSQNYIDNVKLELLPACPRPLYLSTMATGTNSGKARWNSTGATTFVVEYDTAGFSLGSGIQQMVSADSIDIDYLESNTSYDVYVRSHCVGDTSAWIGPSRFHTHCEAMPETVLPYTETFDSWVNGENSCYTLASTDANAAPVFVESYYDGTYIEINSDNETASWMSLPAFATQLNNLQVTFKMSNYSSEIPIVLGAMSNPNDISTFDTIIVLYNRNSDEWETFTIPLSIYQGNGSYITFLSNVGAMAYYTGIDSIVVDYLAECPSPLRIAVRTIDHQSAVVSWLNASNGNIAVEYGPIGFTLGQGIQQTVSADSIVISGLNALTMYSVYVRSVCGDESSEWLGPFSFRTPQGATCATDVTTNAYVENFNFYNNISVGTDTPVDYPNHDLPACWNILNISQTRTEYPRAFISSLSSYAVDGNCLFLTAKNNKSVYMVLPQFTSDIEDLRLAFTYRNEGSSSSNGTLSLGVMSNPNDTATFCLLESYAKTGSKTRIEHIFSNDTLTGTGYYLVFKYNVSGSTAYYLGIDNVVVDLAPDCIKPSNLSVANSSITPSSAQLDWTEAGSATSWLVEYGPAGFEPGTGSSVMANAKPYTLQGLNASAEYDFYVRSLCASGDTSEYSMTYARFTTACEIISTFPWTANFDGPWEGYDNPLCWEMQDNEESWYYWTYTDETDYVRSGSKALYYAGSYSSYYYHDDWMITPEIQLTGNKELRFWARAYSSSYPTQFSVYAYTVNPNDTELSTDNFVRLSDVISVTSTQYTEYVVSLASLTGNVRLAFVVNSQCYDLYIDDVSIVEAPACPQPSRLVASGIRADQAQISWEGTGDLYDIAYGPHGFSLDSIGAYVVINANDESVTLTGLTANTEYDVYVMSFCDASNEMSQWSNVFTFRTLCQSLSVPYSEDFNNYSGSVSVGSNEPMEYPDHVMPNCWLFNMSQTTSTGTRIFLSNYSNYNVSGNSLFFKGSNNIPGYAILPSFSTPIDSLMIEFSYRYESTSTGDAVLGVMTDPYNDSTFIALDTLPRVNSMTETSHAFWNDTVSGTGYYIAIKYVVNNSYSSYYFSIDNMSVEAPNCQPSTNIIASNITSTSADISWNNATADSFMVAYSTMPNFAPENCTTIVGTTTTSVSLSGLIPYTQYYYSINNICSGTTSGWSDLHSFFTLQDCGTATLVEDVIGEGTSTAYSIPFYSGSSYSSGKTWQIYKQEELEGIGIYAGNINSISLQCVSAPANITFKVYMSESDISTFNSASDSIAASQMTLVYNGTTQFGNNSEWTTIVLDNAFQYSGTGNLVIAMERLSTVSASVNFKYHSISGNSLLKYTWDEDIYANVSARRNNIKFNACTSIPTCTRPSNVVVSNIQTTQADLAWTSSAAEFDIAYSVTGFNINNANTYQIVHSIDTAITLTNLMSSTNYDVYVRGICNNGADTSGWSYVSSFQTVCSSVTVPYSENFNSYTSDISTTSPPGTYPNHAMPTCWNFANMSSVYNQYPNAFLSSSSSYSTSGNSLFFRSSQTTSLYAALPRIDVSIDSLFISFAYRNEGTGNSNGTISLGLMTDPTDPTTFVEVMSLPKVDIMTNVEHTFGSNIYTGTNYHIAFRYTGVSNNYWASIDDIFVDYTPTCLIPTNLSVDSISQTTAWLSWTDRNNAGNYTVEYKTVSGSVWTIVSGVTDSSAAITNLNHTTNYVFRVRTICSATDSSNYSDEVNANTLCGIATLPFSEDFSYNTGSDVPQCWEKLEGDLFDSTDVVSTGWSRITSNYGLQGPHIKMNVYGRDKYSIVTPAIDLTNINNAVLSFDLALTAYNSNSAASPSNDDYFIVAVSVDGGATWSDSNAVVWSRGADADSIYNNIPATGVHVTIPLTQYGNNIIKIAFYAGSTVRENGVDNDLHIDNIMVTGGITCPAPVVTVTPGSTDAVVSWTSSATDFQVAYREATATDWGAEIDVTNATSYTITGLQPETNYMVRVRAICDENDASSWEEVAFATTQRPCLIPTNVNAANITYTSAEISWIAQGNETEWEVRYATAGNEDTIVTTTNPVTINNLYSGDQYQVWVRAICGADTYSEWSEVYTFNTATCQTVSNVTATEVGGTRATITWTPLAGQTKWEVRYGMIGTNEENCTPVIVEGNPTCTIEGLETEITYDVYVRNICGDDIFSAWTTKYQFTTTVGINTASNDNVSVQIYPNPANTEATVSVDGIEGKVEFVVADMNGRMIVTETINCEGSLVKTIDVSNLAKGAYFVHIYNSNFNTTRKLIVK